MAVAPVSPELAAHAQAPLNVNGIPDGIREAVVEFFRQNGGTWEVRAQLCTSLDDMPVENAAAVWPEKKSPYRAVARITVKPQDAGVLPARRRWTTGCRSARGMDWLPIALWGRSCGSEKWPTKWDGVSGLKRPAGRSANQESRCRSQIDRHSGLRFGRT